MTASCRQPRRWARPHRFRGHGPRLHATQRRAGLPRFGTHGNRLVTVSCEPTAKLLRAPYHFRGRARHTTGMPAIVYDPEHRWTMGEARALSDVPGERYECVDGELATRGSRDQAPALPTRRRCVLDCRSGRTAHRAMAAGRRAIPDSDRVDQLATGRSRRVANDCALHAISRSVRRSATGFSCRETRDQRPPAVATHRQNGFAITTR